MKFKFGVVVFPGSNCDHDSYHVLKHLLDLETVYLWHKDTDLQNCEVIILPGGFSYGDYIRTGAVAKLSPIMNSVIAFANKGGVVFGICNGFQILTECGLLPGTLIKNKNLKFVCKDIYITAVNDVSLLTKSLEKKTLMTPVAHGEGNYFTDEETLKSLEQNNQVLFRYSSKKGEISETYNPNGSVQNIAGVMNKNGNVFGMMPHPERSSDVSLGKTDGLQIFNSLLQNFIN
ncbi:MAG: phosphoribosylformylglycinamidine synthase subunit PurQ [Ignavibacteria bacterium]|nr:phosphoribosylformylglycinamidine synthase subunit PurQ [Ignavibacteria bacterium]NCS81620.1 phosphoribosylformylglycinamidine synthase subunit PurQ [Ignavibacteria bacterium]OIO13898.1 MAG: phosphoribosylformylglycinamidine synthase I [Ignavibacteria bacterium CG1_02_37_35]PIS45246.1 MAG: phosphoribosylformylglycinamidine synthase I [Ignavibacteria bacterium CG08_land_8_20_14_0_20_37_9]PIX94497.1 MAG: phosphoribosylformylglycinamidine synthase I [Ignavibacteria bacterium CG_4_10_14_3_um_fil